MPAQANIVANANEMCRMIAKFNRKHGMAMAPGTAGSTILANQKYSGYSYSQLWNMAKKLGTAGECRRMY